MGLEQVPVLKGRGLRSSPPAGGWAAPLLGRGESAPPQACRKGRCPGPPGPERSGSGSSVTLGDVRLEKQTPLEKG